MAEEKADNLNRYKEEISSLQQKTKQLKHRIILLGKDKDQSSPSMKPYYTIIIANEYLNMSELAHIMNDTSQKYKGTKRDDFLNASRKAFFNGLIETEKITEASVDTPLNENRDIVKAIEKINPKQILNLFNKFESCLANIINDYGSNSKYKWSFVDMEGRYITAVKHLLDYRRLLQNDPRDPFYPENVKLLMMIKEKLNEASSLFRDKYMLGTKEVADIKQAIAFQSALRKIYILLGDTNEAETSKKTIDNWSQLLEDEEKRKEEKQKREQRKQKGKQ